MEKEKAILLQRLVACRELHGNVTRVIISLHLLRHLPTEFCVERKVNGRGRKAFKGPVSKIEYSY